MKQMLIHLVILALLALAGCGSEEEAETQSAAPEPAPIVIGAPLSTQYLYGWAAQRGMQLAVEEAGVRPKLESRGLFGKGRYARARPRKPSRTGATAVFGHWSTRRRPA